MKKLVSVLLVAFILIVSTVCCFAASISDYPDAGYQFTQVVSGQAFFRVSISDVSSLAPVGQTVELFNGVGLYRISSDEFFIVYDGHRGDNFLISSMSNYYLYFFFKNDTFLYVNWLTADNAFGSSISGVHTVSVDNVGVLSNSMLDIAFGSSFEGNSTVTERYSYSLSAGNVFRVYSDSDFEIVRRGYTISDSSWNFQTLQSASSGASFRVNGARHGLVSNSSIVTGMTNSVFGSSIDADIQWQPTNANVFGNATNYSYVNTDSLSVPAGSSYLVWYPTYYGSNNPAVNDVPIVMSLTISHSSPVYIQALQLTASSSDIDGALLIQSSYDGTSHSGSMTDDGNGNITVVTDGTVSGGGNAGQPSIDSDDSIISVIRGFISRISALFTAAADAVKTLVNSGQDFMRTVLTMFSWLPSELLSVILSAITLLIVIGVIKLLL